MDFVRLSPCLIRSELLHFIQNRRRNCWCFTEVSRKLYGRRQAVQWFLNGMRSAVWTALDAREDDLLRMFSTPDEVQDSNELLFACLYAVILEVKFRKKRKENAENN